MDNVIRLKIPERKAKKTGIKTDKPAEVITLFSEEILNKKDVDLLNRMLNGEWTFIAYNDEPILFLAGVEYDFTPEEALYMERKIERDPVLRLGLRRLRRTLGLLGHRREKREKKPEE